MVQYAAELAVRGLLAPLFLGLRWASFRGHPPDGVPASAASLAVAATVALDELFFAAELVSAPVLRWRDLARVSSEMADAVSLYARRGWLRAPASYHPRPPPAEIAARRHRSLRGLSFDEITFESGFSLDAEEPGGERWLSYERNHRAHAWILQHAGRARPWILCFPGYRMGSPLTDLTGFRAAWLHHKLGLNVAIPVIPLHGPRSRGMRSGDGFLTGDFLDTVHMQAQSIWDARRLLGWMRAQGDARTAVYGLSLGAAAAALLAGLEEDIGCVIAGIPASDFLALARAHVPSPAFRLAARAGFDWNAVAQVLSVISPLAVTPLIARERLCLFAGSSDRLVPPTEVLALWRHWGEPRLEWYDGGHVSFLWQPTVRALLRETLETNGFVVR